MLAGMKQRALLIQAILAALGAGVLAGGLLGKVQWLALAGVVASACAELLGLLLCKLQAGTPGVRLAQGAALAAPSAALALVLPLSMLAAAAVVIEAALAGGVQAVLASRGTGAAMRGATSRVLLLRGANLLVLAAGAVLAGLDVTAGTEAGRLVAWGLVLALGSAGLAGVDATVALRGR
jgi:hypothetical protein